MIKFIIPLFLLISCSISYTQVSIDSRLIEARQYYSNREYAKSYAIYAELAEQGNPTAHYNRGILLSKGLGVDKDFALAFKSFYSAALMGNVAAKTQVGIWKVEGIGVSKDVNQGMQWLSDAAADGDLSANFQLARIYSKADSIEKKIPDALLILDKILKNPSVDNNWKITAINSLALYSKLKNISIDQAYSDYKISSNSLRIINDENSAVDADKLNNLKLQIEKLAAEKEVIEKNQIAEREKLAKETQEKINSILASNKAEENKKPILFNYLDVHVLVIGNGAYQGAAKLVNPINDAKEIANKFRGYNFKVTVKYDQDRSGLVRTFNEFSRSAKDADVVIFYYAGHGIQIFGNNFILPTDVDANDFGQASLQAIPLATVLEQYLPGKTRLIFLDACRENPLVRTSSRGVTKGLAPMSVAEGTLISYATKDGGIALDGENQKNSPFTTALLQHIDEPDDIAVVLRRVRQSVIISTNSKQIPWEYGSLTGDSLVLSRLKPINQKGK